MKISKKYINLMWIKIIQIINIMYNNIKFQNMHANIFGLLCIKAYKCHIFVRTSHKKNKIEIFKIEFKAFIYYA